MRITDLRFMHSAILLAILSVGCGSSQGAPENGTATTGQPQAAAPAPGATEGVSIEFHSEPDPPKSGDNAIEVTVHQPDGAAVTDAAVTAVFTMPAMPAMNMPAMRAETTLTHVDGGRYRGNGTLWMGRTRNGHGTPTRGGH